MKDIIIDNTFGEDVSSKGMLVSDILEFLKLNHVKYYYNPKQKRNGKYYEVCYSYDFASLFDPGFSLYGDLEDHELNLDDKETLEMTDECKTFKSSHYDQLDLIQSDIKINVKKEDILCIKTGTQ